MRALMEALQDRGADNDSVVEEEVAPPPATKVARAQGLLAQLGRAVGFNARGAPTPAAPSRRPPAAAPPAPSAPPAKRSHLDALIARDDAADRGMVVILTPMINQMDWAVLPPVVPQDHHKMYWILLSPRG